MSLPLATTEDQTGTFPPARGYTSFLNAPVQTDLARLEADIAILGIPYGAPYGMAGVSNATAAAPAAIRARSTYPGLLEHYDFDFDGLLLDGRDIRIVDCGNVPGDPLDLPGNSERATAAVRAILERGAVPIVLGGDDSIPIPFFRAFEAHGPLSIVQIDAHIDWRHEVGGVTEGYSSTMRRASEMPWIGGMIQVGMRGVGSARQQEVDDALAYGAVLIKAREIHEHGAAYVLDRIPDGGNYLITIDCDGFDPSVMPGANGIVPGGLTFLQVADILRALPTKGRVAGMDIIEFGASKDINGITATTACRLILNLIGALVRSGQFDGKRS